MEKHDSKKGKRTRSDRAEEDANEIENAISVLKRNLSEMNADKKMYVEHLISNAEDPDNQERIIKLANLFGKDTEELQRMLMEQHEKTAENITLLPIASYPIQEDNVHYIFLDSSSSRIVRTLGSKCLVLGEAKVVSASGRRMHKSGAILKTVDFLKKIGSVYKLAIVYEEDSEEYANFILYLLHRMTGVDCGADYLVSPCFRPMFHHLTVFFLKVGDSIFLPNSETMNGLKTMLEKIEYEFPRSGVILRSGRGVERNFGGPKIRTRDR